MKSTQLFDWPRAPIIMASNISSSVTSFAPASIMTTFSSVAATVTFHARSFRAAPRSGLMTISPSTIAHEYAADRAVPRDIGNGRAAMDAPIIAAISGEQSGSTDMTVRLSDDVVAQILREQRADRSVDYAGRRGWPSRSDGPRVLRKPPGILPTE